MASANQPANRMKLRDSSLPVCGKLKEAGTMTSGRVAAPESASACRSISVRLASMRVGSTMNRSPATNAVSSASRVSSKMFRRPDRGQRCDQARQHPETDQQRHANVGNQVDLEPAELLEAEGAGGGCRNREQPVRRQARDEPGGACQARRRQRRARRAAPACARRRSALSRARPRTAPPRARRCWPASKTGSTGCRGRRS